MSFFEFPHTRTYDSDLGWLIKTMKELTDDYSNLVSWMNTHKGEYRNLLNKVNSLQNEVTRLENIIDEKFRRMEAEFSEEIFRQFNIIKSDLLIQLADMNNKLLEMQRFLIDSLTFQTGLIEGYNDLLRNYVDAKLQEFIDSFPDLHTVYVFNPVKGYQTDIQTAVNDLYDLGRSMGLTAYEYDSLGLTAAEYDNLELTAFEYDQFAREYLERLGLIKNPFHYMTSPFTGEYVRLEIVINELVSLHRDDALTAIEYDALDIDASYYDGLDLSAYDYDWHGKTLVA